ncbi:MAG: hypothetical protein NC924_08610 [Candidatus Omnitrophica bacterium]|nr:hypothetical protein [Candidatus Omnitrophota bacterium]
MSETEKQAAQQSGAGGAAKSGPVKVEIPKQCGACNKPVKRVTRYYRNMKFFCNKSCWAKYQEKAAQEKKEAAEKAQAAA